MFHIVRGFSLANMFCFHKFLLNICSEYFTKDCLVFMKDCLGVKVYEMCGGVYQCVGKYTLA